MACILLVACKKNYKNIAVGQAVRGYALVCRGQETCIWHLPEPLFGQNMTVMIQYGKYEKTHCLFALGR